MLRDIFLMTQQPLLAVMRGGNGALLTRSHEEGNFSSQSRIRLLSLMPATILPAVEVRITAQRSADRWPRAHAAKSLSGNPRGSRDHSSPDHRWSQFLRALFQARRVSSAHRISQTALPFRAGTSGVTGVRGDNRARR